MDQNTSLLEKYGENTRSPIPHLNDGMNKAKSEPEGRLEEIADTMLKTLANSLVKLLALLQEEITSTPESRLIIRKPTSNDKSGTSKKVATTKKPSSSKISDQASTGTAQGSKGFWTSSMTERSKQLPLPTQADCVDLPMNSWNGSLKRLASQSWYSVKVTTIAQTHNKNSQKTSSQSTITSSTSKNQDTTKKVKVNQRLQRMIQTTEEREKANQVKKDKKRKRRQAQKLKKKLKTNST